MCFCINSHYFALLMVVNMVDDQKNIDKLLSLINLSTILTHS